MQCEMGRSGGVMSVDLRVVVVYASYARVWVFGDGY